MPVKISRVITNGDIVSVAILAREIWTEHFTPIIGALQVEYMVEKFQSTEAIKSQIADGWEYYLAVVGKERVGYAGLVPDLKNSQLMISKIYLKDSVRGKGIGKALLDFIESRCISENISTLWLTVNRFNDGPVSWYKRRGFRVVDEVKKDIGDGFFMDDYIMEKKI